MRFGDGGSLLLDEIGDMPPDLQAKLLRVVQEGVVTVGSGKNSCRRENYLSHSQPLESLIETGNFMRPVFRLNVIPITVASLGATRGIVELFDHFSAAYACRGPDQAECALHEPAAGLPVGQCQELENFCRRLSLLQGKY